MDAFWIIQNTRKLPNIFDDFLVLDTIGPSRSLCIWRPKKRKISIINWNNLLDNWTWPLGVFFSYQLCSCHLLNIWRPNVSKVSIDTQWVVIISEASNEFRECGSSGEDVPVNAIIKLRNWGTIPSDVRSTEEGIASQFWGMITALTDTSDPELQYSYCY